jgi:hypothetical protein
MRLGNTKKGDTTMKVKKQGRKKQEGITTSSEKGIKEEIHNSLLKKVISLWIESGIYLFLNIDIKIYYLIL